MKNILVPVDFSKYSLSAAKTAAKISEKTNAAIHLLHLIPELPVNWNQQTAKQKHQYPLLEKKYSEVMAELEKFSKNEFLKKCDIENHVQGGVPFEQIELVIKNHAIDLVIIGAHGKGDSGHRFIGSTAQRVIRTAKCPVLSVKKEMHLKALKKIVFVSDFNERITSALSVVKNLAYNFNASIDLVYINTPAHFEDDEVIEKRMKRFINVKKGTRINMFIENNHERESGILNSAKKHQADIIGMATHLRAHKPGYLMSVTESVLFYSDLPVLSMVIDDPGFIIK